MRLKKDSMSSQERMDALLNYRKPDRVPIGNLTMSLGFNTINVGGTIAEAYDDPEKSFQALLETSEQYGWDKILWYYSHTVLGALDFGGEVRLPKGDKEGALVVTSHPVKTEQDIEHLELPDPKTTGFIPRAMRFAELEKKHGFPATFNSRSPFALAANICGLETFLRWAMKKPELCDRLIELAMNHTFNVMNNWVERFGPDNTLVWLNTPSESNQLISPKLFEKMVLPTHFEYHNRLKSLNITQFGVHICGEQNLNLPYLADSPPWRHPSVLSLGHEVDIEVAARYFPEDIIYGNIDPTLLLMGPPSKIYDHCKGLIEQGMRAKGGFILAAGCDISPLTPAENLHAMTKAVEDFGYYD